jgi:hypothetical protein
MRKIKRRLRKLERQLKQARKRVNKLEIQQRIIDWRLERAGAPPFEVMLDELGEKIEAKGRLQ